MKEKVTVDDYSKKNMMIWDRWAREDRPWCRPISHEEYLRAAAGEWNLRLTPVSFVPGKWFPPMAGKKVLGLGAGGGQQMPVLAAHGADVTLFDFCPYQLDLDKQVAEREGYAISLVRGDMTGIFPFDDCMFELLFMPLCAQFARDIRHVWAECMRVLKPGGILMAGFVNPMGWLFEDDDEEQDTKEAPPPRIVRHLPYDPIADGSASLSGMTQFSHSLEALIGGQTDAGFLITGLYEDSHHGGVLREYAPFHFATCSRKPDA